MQTRASLFSPTHTHTHSLLRSSCLIAFKTALLRASLPLFLFSPLNGKGLQMRPAGVQLRLCVRAKCQQPLEGAILERASTLRAELTAGVALDSRGTNDQLLVRRRHQSRQSAKRGSKKSFSLLTGGTCEDEKWRNSLHQSAPTTNYSHLLLIIAPQKVIGLCIPLAQWCACICVRRLLLTLSVNLQFIRSNVDTFLSGLHSCTPRP